MLMVYPLTCRAPNRARGPGARALCGAVVLCCPQPGRAGARV